MTSFTKTAGVAITRKYTRITSFITGLNPQRRGLCLQQATARGRQRGPASSSSHSHVSFCLNNLKVFLEFPAFVIPDVLVGRINARLPWCAPGDGQSRCGPACTCRVQRRDRRRTDDGHEQAEQSYPLLWWILLPCHTTKNDLLVKKKRKKKGAMSEFSSTFSDESEDDGGDDDDDDDEWDDWSSPVLATDADG